MDVRGHLTYPQQLLLRPASEVLAYFAYEHQQAISTVLSHEKEKLFVMERAKSLLQIKSEAMSVAAKVAFVGYQFPRLMKRGELTIKSDATDLVGEKFQRGLADMARDAVKEANQRELTINEAVDLVWDRFEVMRPSFEKELAVRTHAYTRQLARQNGRQALKEMAAPA